MAQNCQQHRNKHRHLRLVTDEPRIPKRALERALHHLTLIACDSVASDVEPQHQDWWYDLRRERVSLCGGVFRFLAYLHRWGFPIETALLIPDWITAKIYDVWNQSPPSTPAIQVKLVRTGEFEKAS